MRDSRRIGRSLAPLSFSLALSLVLSLALSGCGGDREQSGSGPGQQGQQGQQAQQAQQGGQQEEGEAPEQSSGEGEVAAPEATAGDHPEGPPTRGGAHPPFELVIQHVFNIDGEDPGIDTAVSANGSWGAALDNRGMAALIDMRSGTIRAARRLFRLAYERDVQFGPGNARIIAVESSSICVWHLLEDRVECIDHGHSDISPLLARGGQRLFAAHFRRPSLEIKVWRLGTEQMRRFSSLPGWSEGVERAQRQPRMELDSRGRHLVVGDGQRAWIIDGRSGELKRRFEDRSVPEQAFSPDGSNLALIGEGGLSLHDPQTGEQRGETIAVALSARSRLFWNDAGTALASCLESGEAAVRVDLTAGSASEPQAIEGCGAKTLRPTASGIEASPAPRLEYNDEYTIAVEHPRARREHRIEIHGAERSLWSVGILENGVTTSRRNNQERWDTEGAHVVADFSRPDPETGENLGSVLTLGTSPSGEAVVRVATPDFSSTEPDYGEAATVIRGSESVTLSERFPIACAGDYCTPQTFFSPDEGSLALVDGARAWFFDTRTGQRRGVARLVPGCTPACEEPAEVCEEGMCSPLGNIFSFPLASVHWARGGQRLVTVANHNEAWLRSGTGDRIANLGHPDVELQPTRQHLAFSEDGSQLAFVRRRRLQLLSSEDGSEIRVITIPHPARWLGFADLPAEEGATEGARGPRWELRVLTERDEMLFYSAADGSLSRRVALPGVRAINPERMRAVTCRQGFVFLRRIGEERERGPLGRCPAHGDFQIGERYLTWKGGNLARVHRISDGEVLNLRAHVHIARSSGDLVTSLIAFTDAGAFEVTHPDASLHRVREGGMLSGQLRNISDHPGRREGLVRAFFRGEPVAPPAPAAETETE